MPLHKHSFVRAISAFSLILIFTIWFGAAAPEVKAKAVSAQAARTALSQTKNSETARVLRAQVQQKQLARDTLAQRLAAVRYSLPLLEQQVSQLDADICLLQAELELLERQENPADGDAAEAMAALSGGFFVWPMPGYSSITCDFGSGHRGIDIAGSGISGAPITAADGGTVTHSGWMNSYGYCVFIDHGNGYETSYSHLSKISVTKGQRVRRGDIIALSGDTGLSLAPHLHYEVRLKGVRVDPIHYFFMELKPSEYQRLMRIAQSGMQAFD